MSYKSEVVRAPFFDRLHSHDRYINIISYMFNQFLVYDIEYVSILSYDLLVTLQT